MVDSRTIAPRRIKVAAVVVLVLCATLAFALSGGAGAAPSVRSRAETKAAVPPVGAVKVTSSRGSRSTVATSTPVTSVPAEVTSPAVVATPIVATAPKVTTVPVTSVSTLVSEVEAAGIDPGANWSWTMGNTAPECGVISGVGTGCTYGADGREYSIFAGTPTLALVAHELANAETQNDAVPSLLNEVAAAAAGTSWSPTDAVASCLVAHFMGFQDDAAGTFQCSAALATIVADNIHDTY
jgi:hypothetical protein